MTVNLETSQDMSEMDKGLSTVTSVLLAVIGPFVLILLGMVMPIHFAMEEVWKLLSVTKMSHKLGQRMKASYAMGLGILFGMTELVLFVMNAFNEGNWQVWWYRLLLTVPMHGVTTLVMFVIGRRGRAWWVAGLAAAIAIHGLFNYWVR